MLGWHRIRNDLICTRIHLILPDDTRLHPENKDAIKKNESDEQANPVL